MVAQHFRWDFVGLSTDTKPTPETSEKVVDGSTFYCSDTSKLYVFCKDDWYERKPLGGGGGGTTYTAGDGITIADDTISVDLAQTTGSSTTKVMSQKATTDFVSGRVMAGSAPTTSTEGTVGQLYEDTTNGKLYQCTAIVAGTDPDPDTYTWSEIGGGVTPVQTTGTSTTDVMSQNAVTSMIYADASTPSKIRIGNTSNLLAGSIAIGSGTNVIGTQSTGIGDEARSSATATAVGYGSEATYGYSTALGFGAKAGGANSIGFAFSNATRQGEMALGLVGSQATQGYNNTAYRLISGVHDGQDAHDAVTVAQVNATIDAINTALSTNIPHIGASS